MALEMVDKVVKDPVLMYMFNIHDKLVLPIKQSWEEKQPDLQGRFDFDWKLHTSGASNKTLAISGMNWQPKLLEYNADTPSLQLESGIISQEWFETKGKIGNHQSNYLDEAFTQTFDKLIWKQCTPTHESKRHLGVAQLQEDDENTAVMRYFFKLLHKYSPHIIDITSLKIEYIDGKPYWADGFHSAFECLFSLYPKEWLVTEMDHDPLVANDLAELRSIEPWWKLLLGNKALLPLLWATYPHHPSILPAYYSDPKTELGHSTYSKHFGANSDGDWVSKPIFGREGAGVFMANNFTTYDQFRTITENNYGID